MNSEVTAWSMEFLSGVSRVCAKEDATCAAQERVGHYRWIIRADKLRDSPLTTETLRALFLWPQTATINNDDQASVSRLGVPVLRRVQLALAAFILINVSS